MILTVHSVAQVIMRRDQHLLPLHYNFFIVKTVSINATLLKLPSIYLRPLPYVCPSSLRIQLPEPLKLVTSILVGDNVMNNTSLLFFLTCVCLMLFIFTYLNMSLPAGIHESLSTCKTCVYLMVNTPSPCIYNMLNMLFMHVYIIF
jgi:hypothetical protein